MFLKILKFVLTIACLYEGAHASDDSGIGEGISSCDKVLSLQEIAQAYVASQTPTYYSQEEIKSLPYPIQDDMICKRQLPIQSPLLTKDILDSLLKKSIWQDSWGYYWKLGVHKNIYLLLEQESSFTFDCKSIGDHTYDYSASFIYRDMDPVDMVEVETYSVATARLSLK